MVVWKLLASEWDIKQTAKQRFRKYTEIEAHEK